MADRKASDPASTVRPVALAAALGTDSTTSLSGLQVVPVIPPQPNAPARRAFHAVDGHDACRYWSTTQETGLAPDEAARRLERLGPNKLPETAAPPLWKRLLAQVSDFTVLTLLGAAAIAAGLSIFAPEPGASFLAKFGDSIAILLIVVLNAVLGLVQEKRAEDALRALRDMTAPNAHVLRGGKLTEVPSIELVPGDIVQLEEGDKVAADLRLLTAADLEIEEASLTGESLPVAKDATATLEPEAALADRVNMAFLGTRVARGRGRGVVCNTGIHSELGSIAGMLAEVEDEDTPLQRQLDRFGRDIVIGCIVISAIVFLAGWQFGGYAPREMFLVAVALAVAAIPEGLPAITTITLALGTARMAKRNALVRKLPAVETLGCAQIVCTDKTGTLTQNAMAVRRLWVGSAAYQIGGEARELVGELRPDGTAAHEGDLELALRTANHANGARLNPLDGDGQRVAVFGDPTDAALLILARKGKRPPHEGTVRGEVPFTSSRRMATVISDEGSQAGLVAFMRGAPEVLLELSEQIREGGTTRAMTSEDRTRILAVAADWGQAAMRVLALAVRDTVPEGDAVDFARWERGLTFVGLVGIVDPPRPEVAAAIAEAAAAGIRTVMITGDHPATARAIAQEIGLWTERDIVLTGGEIDRLDPQRLEAIILRVRVVARATAAHKLRIVEAFKAVGVVCAMTGDGVNDAPAVKGAHIGIAMGRAGTEVTKEAADLVLADDNYATIVAAVEEGRSIYANIRKFIFFLLSSNAGIVFVVLFASLVGWQAPLTPIQILWINLITNGLPALALGVDPKDPDQMHTAPRPLSSRLLGGQAWLSLAVVGAVMAATALWVFWWAGGGHHSDPVAVARARALCFTVLSIGPMFHALNCRSASRSIFQLGLFTNRTIWAAFAVGVALQALALYMPALNPVFKTEPLGFADLGIVFALAAVPLFLGELVKIAVRMRPSPSTLR